MKISTLTNLVTDLMAIDLGTARTIIAVKGRSIVLDEPSYIAVDKLTREILAYGQEAYDMQGREGRDITVVAPLSSGVVADFERTKKLLAHFVKKSKTGGLQASTHAVMSMVSDITQVEQRALLNAAKEAHVRKVYVMEEGLAAAFGAGVSPKDNRASAIVDIGAGTTNIAIVAKGLVIHSRSERIGSNEINIALSNYIRHHRGLQVGAETTEKLKINFASTFLPDDVSQTMPIRGRDLQTGSPGEVEISAGEVYPVIESIVCRVARFVSNTLTELRPEVAADIFDRGIILTGGGALLKGLDLYIRGFVNLPVIVSNEPCRATIRGLLKMLDEPELLKKVSRRHI